MTLPLNNLYIARSAAISAFLIQQAKKQQQQEGGFQEGYALLNRSKEESLPCIETASTIVAHLRTPGEIQVASQTSGFVDSSSLLGLDPNQASIEYDKLILKEERNSMYALIVVSVVNKILKERKLELTLENFCNELANYDIHLLAKAIKTKLPIINQENLIRHLTDNREQILIHAAIICSENLKKNKES